MNRRSLLFQNNRFGERSIFKILRIYMSSNRKLCEIIEDILPSFSEEGKNYIMDICESVIPSLY